MLKTGSHIIIIERHIGCVLLLSECHRNFDFCNLIAQSLGLGHLSMAPHRTATGFWSGTHSSAASGAY